MSQVTSQQNASQQNGSQQHSSATSQAEQQIRELVSQYVSAVTAKDVARIASLYSDDVVAFDAILALQFIGKAAYMEHWQTCMGFAPGDMHFAMHQLTVEATEQLAFSHSISQCGCENADGDMQTGWMRSTQCWRNTGDGWKIAHEHFSAPFDVETGQALCNLQP